MKNSVNTVKTINAQIKVEREIASDSLNTAMNTEASFLGAVNRYLDILKDFPQHKETIKPFISDYLNVILDWKASKKNRIIKTELLRALLSNSQYAKLEGKAYELVKVYYFNDKNEREDVGSFKFVSGIEIEKQVGEFLAKRANSKLYLSIGLNELIDSDYKFSFDIVEGNVSQKFTPREIQDLIFKAKTLWLKHHKDVTDAKVNEATLRNALNLGIDARAKEQTKKQIKEAKELVNA